LVFGLWSLVFGLWSLVFGLWSLVFGLSKMVRGEPFPGQEEIKAQRPKTVISGSSFPARNVFELFGSQSINTDTERAKFEAGDFGVDFGR
jgi:hypothetical protein